MTETEILFCWIGELERMLLTEDEKYHERILGARNLITKLLTLPKPLFSISIVFALANILRPMLIDMSSDELAILINRIIG